MGRITEETAALVRLAMGLTPGELPTRERLEWFAEQVPGLSVEYDSLYPYSCFLAESPGRGIIMLPPAYRPESFVHELGHAFRGDGLACVLREWGTASGDPRLLALADRVGWQEEAGARRFVLAVFLPPELVLSHRDYDLAELTGWSVETIRARRWGLLRNARQLGLRLEEYAEGGGAGI